MKPKATPALWLDIDGTVRKGLDELGRFVNTAADVEVFPEAVAAMQKYKASGYRIIGISNQGGVALGHLTERDCVAAMAETQRQTNNLFDRITFCLHHPQASDPEYAVCWCRKPRIGLLIHAGISLSEQYGECYPPHLGLMVGDRPEDEECARNANLQFMSAADWRARG